MHWPYAHVEELEEADMVGVAVLVWSRCLMCPPPAARLHGREVEGEVELLPAEVVIELAAGGKVVLQLPWLSFLMTPC